MRQDFLRFDLKNRFLQAHNVFLKDDKTVLEAEPLERVTQMKEIKAMRHEGFWQCMDHKLDKDLLDKMVAENNAPWIK